jgi:hypothetical protein
MNLINAAALVSLALVPLALAQDQKQPSGQPVRPSTPGAASTPGAPTPAIAEEAARKEPWRVSFTLKGSHAFSADLDGTPGEFAVSRLGADLGLLIPVSEKARLAVGLDWTQSLYDFKDATGFAPGFSEPWSDTFDVGLSAIYSRPLEGAWGMFIGALANSSGEEGADFSDTLTYGGLGGVSYQFSETFTASIGVLAQSRLEDSAMVIPIPGIDWKISEEWRLSSMNKPGLSLFYSPSKEWTFSLGATYEGREFRLNDRDAAPEGVGRDRGVPVLLGAEWSPSRRITVGGFVGAYVYRKLRLEDNGGNELSEFEVDPAPTAGLNIKFAF